MSLRPAVAAALTAVSLTACSTSTDASTAGGTSDAVLELCGEKMRMPKVAASTPVEAAEAVFPEASFVDAQDPWPQSVTYEVDEPSGILTVSQWSNGTWHPSGFVYC